MMLRAVSFKHPETKKTVRGRVLRLVVAGPHIRAIVEHRGRFLSMKPEKLKVLKGR